MDDDGDRAVAAGEPAQGLDAVHSRHRHVEDDDVGTVPLDSLERIDPVHRQLDLVTGFLELLLTEDALVLLVLYYQYALHTSPYA